MGMGIFFWLPAFVCAVSTANLAKLSEEKDTSATIEIPYHSKYIWRGTNLVDSSVLQPTLSLEDGGFYFEIWTNIELTDKNSYPPFGSAKGKLTEIDLTFAYTLNCSNTALSFGFIKYLFPNTDFNATSEIYASAGFDLPFSPRITIYKDIEATGGTYASLEFSQSALSDKIGLFASIAYADKKSNESSFGVSKSGWVDATVSANIPINLGDWELTPGITWVYLPDRDIAASATRRSTVFFSFSASFGF